MSKILSLICFSSLNAANFTELFAQEGMLKTMSEYLDLTSLSGFSCSSSIFKNEEETGVKRKKEKHVTDIIGDTEKYFDHRIRHEVCYVGGNLYCNPTTESLKNIRLILEKMQEIERMSHSIGCDTELYAKIKNLGKKMFSYILTQKDLNDENALNEFFYPLNVESKLKFLTTLVKVNSINSEDKNYHLYLFEILSHIPLVEVSTERELQIYFTSYPPNRIFFISEIDLFSTLFHVFPKIYNPVGPSRIEQCNLRLFGDSFCRGFSYSDKNKLKDFIESIKNTVSDFCNTILPIINDPETWRYAIKTDRSDDLLSITRPHSQYTILENHADIRYDLLNKSYGFIRPKLYSGVMLYPELKDQFYRVMDKIILDICDGKEYRGIFAKKNFYNFDSQIFRSLEDMAQEQTDAFLDHAPESMDQECLTLVKLIIAKTRYI